MGKNKESGSSTQVVNQTTTPTPTPEETALNQLQLGQAQAFDPYQRQINASAGNLINQLLTGQTDLPGFFKDIYKGVNQNLSITPPSPLVASEYQVTPELTNEIVQQSLRDIAPQFQQSGILDSGVAAQIAGRSASDIRRNVAERNLETSLNVGQYNRELDLGTQQYNIDTRRAGETFNLGNLLNLLNLAVGGQAQVQQPVLATSQMLGQRLAGLRSINQQGTTTGNTTQYSMNPFMKSFQTQLGKTLGGGQVSIGIGG